MADPKPEPSTPHGEGGDAKPKPPTREPSTQPGDGAGHGGSGPTEREPDPSLQPT